VSGKGNAHAVSFGVACSGLQPNRGRGQLCKPPLARRTRARAVAQAGAGEGRCRGGGAEGSHRRRRRARAAADGGGRGSRRERGALEGGGGTPSCWMGEQVGAADQPRRCRHRPRPPAAAAAGACRSRHPPAMVELTYQQIRRRRGSPRRASTQPTAWISLVAVGDCASPSTHRMEPMHCRPPGDLGRTCTAAGPVVAWEAVPPRTTLP
jgi:hypothetical protein